MSNSNRFFVDIVWVSTFFDDLGIFLSLLFKNNSKSSLALTESGIFFVELVASTTTLFFFTLPKE